MSNANGSPTTPSSSSNKRRRRQEDADWDRPDQRGYPCTKESHADPSRMAEQTSSRAQSYSHNNESSYSQGRGIHPTETASRGRGRGRTLPAWMTKDSDGLVGSAIATTTAGDGGGGDADDNGPRAREPERGMISSFDNHKESVFDELIRHIPPPVVTRPPDQWPPCFETNGSDFVFDTRSAMFYHACSEFFYDPKTKLYYGNKQGAYFRFDGSSKGPGALSFVEIEKAVPTATNEPDAVFQSVERVKVKKQVATISIKLKSKKLPKSKKEKVVAAVVIRKPIAAAVAAVEPSRVPKSHAADMAKWSQRTKEAESVDKPPSGPKITQTNKGKPICVLCQRKFASLEKLRYHEKASALHQENLAKHQAQAAAKVETANDEAPVNYVDRAQQRRSMHGTDKVALPLPPAALSPPSVARLPPPPEPSENLGQSNIGNQMLQRLGWKSGEALGKQGSDSTAKHQGAQQAGITKEWEKIESIASNGGGKQKSKRKGPRSCEI